MQLPIQSTPEYSVELPVSKKTVKYRPFLVKEQRNMIMIKQDASVMEMYYAIVSMLQSVCLSDLKIDELPMTDVEYLFMLVRTKSVGETQDVTMPCIVEDCDGTAKYKSDLSNLEIIQPDNRADGLVKLNEELSVQLVVPSSKQMMSVMDKDESEMIKDLMLVSMTKIYDKENIYDLSEYRDSEIVDFLESLTIEQFANISKFYEDLPVMKIHMKGICEKCETKQDRTLQGFANFF